jgi:hypothetical protein
MGIMSFIKGDDKLFKNEKGYFGNLSGNFINLLGYQNFLIVLKKVFI